jgi:hypothetical protein
MPTPTIPAGNLFMNATLYTGNSGTQTVSNGVAGQSFHPDLFWIKSRTSGSEGQMWNDTVRGLNKQLFSNNTAIEQGSVDQITAFTSTGFTTGASGTTNGSGQNYVAWQWKAGGAAVTNTAGAITSSVSSNPTSGFSVVTYTGTLTAAGTATVGHGLLVGGVATAPSMIIFKARNAVTSWPTFHTSLTNWNYSLFLDLTNAQTDQTSNGSMSAPTTTVFSTNWTTGMNVSGNTQVAYCFAPVAGYSAFGSYTGNGSADGPFVYLGFRPRYLMIKSSSDVTSWWVYDSSRNTYNAVDLGLLPNLTNADTSGYPLDFLSNGFKFRNSNGDFNGSGRTYIYMAFAENPFKYANAR